MPNVRERLRSLIRRYVFVDTAAVGAHYSPLPISSSPQAVAASFLRSVHGAAGSGPAITICSPSCASACWSTGSLERDDLGRSMYSCFPSGTAAFSFLRIFAEPAVVRSPGPPPFVRGLLLYFLLCDYCPRPSPYFGLRKGAVLRDLFLPVLFLLSQLGFKPSRYRFVFGRHPIFLFFVKRPGRPSFGAFPVPSGVPGA